MQVAQVSMRIDVCTVHSCSPPLFTCALAVRAIQRIVALTGLLSVIHSILSQKSVKEHGSMDKHARLKGIAIFVAVT